MQVKRLSHFTHENPRHRIYRKKWTLRYQVQWLEPWAFHWSRNGTVVEIEANSTQDGHSIPLPITVSILTLGEFHPMMSGLKAAAVHDRACRLKLYNRRDRYRLYRDALAETRVEKWKSSVLWKAAAVGSWIGFC